MLSTLNISTQQKSSFASNLHQSKPKVRHHTPMFTGYDDFLSRKRIGVWANWESLIMVSFGTFVDDSIKAIERVRFRVFKITFADNSQAHFKYADKVSDRKLREKGAYLINKLMGLNFIPKTDLIQLTSNELDDTIPVKLGSIQESINGHHLKECEREDHKHITDENKQDVVDMIGLTFMLCDWDKHGANIMFDPAQEKYFLIDNEYSGRADFMERSLYPPVFKRLVHNEEALSPQFLEKLNAFIENIDKYGGLLCQYYSGQELSKILHRADQLLSEGCLSKSFFISDQPSY